MGAARPHRTAPAVADDGRGRQVPDRTRPAGCGPRTAADGERHPGARGGPGRIAVQGVARPGGRGADRLRGAGSRGGRRRGHRRPGVRRRRRRAHRGSPRCRTRQRRLRVEQADGRRLHRPGDHAAEPAAQRGRRPPDGDGGRRAAGQHDVVLGAAGAARAGLRDRRPRGPADGVDPQHAGRDDREPVWRPLRQRGRHLPGPAEGDGDV